MKSRSITQWIREEISPHGFYGVIGFLLEKVIGPIILVSIFVFSFSYVSKFIEIWFESNALLVATEIALSIGLTLVVALSIIYVINELRAIPHRIRASKERRICVVTFFIGATIAAVGYVFSFGSVYKLGIFTTILAALGALAWDSIYEKLICGIRGVIRWVNGNE